LRCCIAAVTLLHASLLPRALPKALINASLFTPGTSYATPQTQLTPRFRHISHHTTDASQGAHFPAYHRHHRISDLLAANSERSTLDGTNSTSNANNFLGSRSFEDSLGEEECVSNDNCDNSQVKLCPPMDTIAPWIWISGCIYSFRKKFKRVC